MFSPGDGEADDDESLSLPHAVAASAVARRTAPSARIRPRGVNRNRMMEPPRPRNVSGGEWAGRSRGDDCESALTKECEPCGPLSRGSPNRNLRLTGIDYSAHPRSWPAGCFGRGLSRLWRWTWDRMLACFRLASPAGSAPESPR